LPFDVGGGGGERFPGGPAVSYFFGMPSGAGIILVSGALFGVEALLGRMMRLRVADQSVRRMKLRGGPPAVIDAEATATAISSEPP